MPEVIFCGAVVSCLLPARHRANSSDQGRIKVIPGGSQSFFMLFPCVNKFAFLLLLYKCNVPVDAFLSSGVSHCLLIANPV